MTKFSLFKATTAMLSVQASITNILNDNDNVRDYTVTRCVDEDTLKSYYMIEFIATDEVASDIDHMMESFYRHESLFCENLTDLTAMHNFDARMDELTN